MIHVELRDRDDAHVVVRSTNSQRIDADETSLWLEREKRGGHGSSKKGSLARGVTTQQ